ncbi:MAG: hypothetical protein LBR05_00920 [Azoarcus sp.]|jgi:hypothetical protein|nr:hypothetical protein [Azoarcus sp.]
MPALNFQRRFVPLIERGEKNQTMRAVGKRTIRPGDKLALYTGQRTKGCQLIGHTVCTDVSPFQMLTSTRYFALKLPAPEFPALTLLRPLNEAELEDLALHDGFASADEMFDWFMRQHGRAIEGNIIRWRPLPASLHYLAGR